MAAIFLPAPGTEYGPCIEPCSHVDCAATREQAASVCARCGQPIGYDTRFYTGIDPTVTDRWQSVAHMVCELKEIDSQRPVPGRS